MDCRAAIAEGRLLIVSQFKENVCRVTAKTAMARNRIVADLAEAVVIAHAAPASKIEALTFQLLVEEKPIYTFDHPANAAILDRGARDVGRLAWH